MDRVGARSTSRIADSTWDALRLNWTVGVALVVAAAVLMGGCGGGESTAGNVSATIDGASWHSRGEGFVISGSGGPTTFDVQAGTLLPNSSLLDSSKPQLLIVFQGVPSVSTYAVDGVNLVVEYQPDTSSIYSPSTGSVQITGISTSRAQGAFNFELTSPTATPSMLTVTDGAFDVPVSAH
jgi:hypothetical protein